MKQPLLKSQRGFTLIDVLVTMLILTIALLGTMMAFPTIMKAILVSKARSLAITVAQEQLESLRNVPYYKLRVTTSTVIDTRFTPPVEYDNSIYPKENVLTGGVVYEKVVYVEKVSAAGNENFQHVDWTNPDVGMKRATVYVFYRFQGGSGNWKKISLSALIENPDRQQINAAVAGIVQSTSGARLPGAYISVLENPALRTYSDVSGNYRLEIPAGQWTLSADATGYFVSQSSITTSSGTTTSKSFTLTRQFVGSISGSAFILNHLVIAQVLASTGTTDANSCEFIELYNPCTYPVLIASRTVAGGAFDVHFVTVSYIDQDNNSVGSGSSVNLNNIGGTLWNFRSSSTWHGINSPTIAVASNGYFLIANVSTVTVGTLKRRADAYYSGNRIFVNQGGGVLLAGGNGLAQHGQTNWHDGLAWSNTNAGKSGPALCAESSAVNLANGFQTLSSTAGILQRVSYKSSTGTVFTANTTRLWASPAGNSFDRNVNGPSVSTGGDFLSSGTAACSYTFANQLCNMDTQMSPYSGTPAAGAIVSASDELSDLAFVQSYGDFKLNNVSSGAWIVSIVSATVDNTYYQEIYTTMALTTPNLSVPNATSVPSWNFSTAFSSLTLLTDNGIVAGRVTTPTGNGISNITISAQGISRRSDAQGYYRIPLSSGSYKIECNLTAPINNTYTQSSSAAVKVTLGQITDGVDFTLFSGGALEGFVTPNGVDPLPGYILSLQKNGAEYKTAISGTDGKFFIANVATTTTGAPYTLYCITESNEILDFQDGIISTPIAGSTVHVGTFTITTGQAVFTGTVKQDNDPIETGVILAASTQPISTTQWGPTIDRTLTSGTTPYYFAASDAQGKYTLKVLGGRSYFIYGWYKKSDLVVQKSSAPTVTIQTGETKTINFFW